jgi:hypothetical protein
MRKTIISGIIASVFGLLTPNMLPAQGTMYLSNLDQSSVGSLAVGSNSWIAGLFVVGQNPGGYVLNSVELAMNDAVGNPSGLQAMIYSSGGGGYSPPAFYVGTLEGSLDPVSAGIYTFTPAEPITLLKGGGYSIVLTSGTAVADGAYEWSYGSANSYNPSGGWFTLPGGVSGAWISSNGSIPSWVRNGSAFPQFAIEATAVPEPGVLSLIVLGGLHLVWHRRRAKAI